MTAPFDGHILESPFRIVFISKFIYNMHHIVLMRSGILKLPYKKFVRYDFFSSLIWIAIVGGLGYFSGVSFNLVKRNLKFAEFALLGGLAIFLLLEFAVVKLGLKKKL